jgi:spoIIIJ-associated protein
MENEQRILESSGENVEKAIEEGLSELGLSRDEVTVDVLDEGSSGLLGLRRRAAKVRLTTIEQQPLAAENLGGDLDDPSEELNKAEAKFSSDVVAANDTERQIPDKMALEVIEALLDKMAISASISSRETEPDDITGEIRMVIDIHGEDMGILIGPRGDTLNALQYLARLMTGHMTRHRPTFIVDVEGYRERREQALARLAERMAGKVIARKRPITLEAMPPNERRIVHLTLRDNDQVYTESSGEGNYRKVRIFPKS